MKFTIEELDRSLKTMRGEIAEDLHAIGENVTNEKAADIAWRIRMVLDMTTALEIVEGKRNEMQEAEAKR